jgi:hypothetical protein
METRQTPKTCHKLKDFQPLSPRKKAHLQSDRFVLDQAGGQNTLSSATAYSAPNVARIIQGVTLPTFSRRLCFE